MLRERGQGAPSSVSNPNNHSSSPSQQRISIVHHSCCGYLRFTIKSRVNSVVLAWPQLPRNAALPLGESTCNSSKVDTRHTHIASITHLTYALLLRPTPLPISYNYTAGFGIPLLDFSYSSKLLQSFLKARASADIPPFCTRLFWSCSLAQTIC